MAHQQQHKEPRIVNAATSSSRQLQQTTQHWEQHAH